MREAERDICIFSFTEKGSQMNQCLCERIRQEGISCQGYTIHRCAGGGLLPLPENGKVFIGERWNRSDFIFIGAAGIAVRYIAPWVKDKYSDPAVLVLDENGQYVIPLLSGHVGGAVELADRIAMWFGATAVHTTATDVQGRFAVDTFARKNNLIITDRETAKRISAAVLEGEKVAIYAPDCMVEKSTVTAEDGNEEGVVPGNRTGLVNVSEKKTSWPAGLVWCTSETEWMSYRYRVIVEECEEKTGAEPEAGERAEGAVLSDVKKQNHTGVLKDAARQNRFSEQMEVGEQTGAFDGECREYVLRLVRKKKGYVLGVGCRKGLDPQLFEQGILQILEKNRIHPGQIQAIASIDLKKNEQAIVMLADKWKVPFVTYCAEQLNEVEKVSSVSAFVKQTTGTDNVCERAAKRYCMEKCGTEGMLIQEKTAGEGMTASIVRITPVLIL